MIEALIRKYLDEEGIYKDEISNPNLAFGYSFTFPPGFNNGHLMQVFRPKKKDCILIYIGTEINDDQVKILESMDEKEDFFQTLRKYLVMKDVFFGIDILNGRYEIVDQIFLKNDGTISKNALYQSIRRVFNCAMYGDLLLSEYCSENMELGELYEPRNFNSGTDFSLYS